MSRSNDPGHYFQTSSALATSERKAAKSQNKLGRPVRFPSKLLAVHPDSFDARAVYVAEAAGEIRRVVLETGEKISVDKATAPLTSLALSPNGRRLFSGCWDKNVYCTDFESGQTQALSAHADFVKCLLTVSVNGTSLLLSGSADATIIVWDLDTGRLLHKLKGHRKGVLCMAVDPVNEEGEDGVVVFSASSDREIRRWRVGVQSASELPESVQNPIVAHETSVYAIRFDSDGDLWTASADKTAKHLVRSRNWEADTTLSHPDFVDDVLMVEELGLVVTACRDEEVRVWDAATGELVVVYEGHYEEVTGLVRAGRNGVASVSIDGTLRRWSLERSEMQKFREEREKEAQGDVDEGEGGGRPKLSAEEEAELADLMSDED